MKIEYFTRKQNLLLSKITLEFTRKEYLSTLHSQNRLVGLIGARGVGKTTLLLQYLKQIKQKYLYI